MHTTSHKSFVSLNVQLVESKFLIIDMSSSSKEELEELLRQQFIQQPRNFEDSCLTLKIHANFARK